MLIIEYHREELLVLAEYLKPHGLREGMLLQFLGELHRKEDKVCTLSAEDLTPARSF